jgi:hypothetical protein
MPLRDRPHRHAAAAALLRNVYMIEKYGDGYADVLAERAARRDDKWRRWEELDYSERRAVRGVRYAVLAVLNWHRTALFAIARDMRRARGLPDRYGHADAGRSDAELMHAARFVLLNRDAYDPPDRTDAARMWRSVTAADDPTRGDMTTLIARSLVAAVDAPTRRLLAAVVADIKHVLR